MATRSRHSRMLFGLGPAVIVLVVLASQLPREAGGQAADPPVTSRAPRCDGLQATILGTAGDDVLNGTPGPDVIVALAGNDTVFGHGGDDLICGGAGDDHLEGGGGDDVLRGETGNDALGAPGDALPFPVGFTAIGDGGDDVMLGGPGDDVLRGGGGDDMLFGEDGNDHLGSFGSDRFDLGDDNLMGGQGVDVCTDQLGHNAVPIGCEIP